MRSPRHTRSSERGFTLIELAVVVVIVGVLSVLAMVGYRRLILSSKLTEARSMIQGIKLAQESYKAERGVYVSIAKDKGCPTASLDDTGKVKTAWNTACPSGGGTTWSALQMHADGAVQFQYFTVAGTTADPALPDDFKITVTGLATLKGRPWYIAAARANLDNDSTTDPTELVSTSAGTDIFVYNEGQ